MFTISSDQMLQYPPKPLVMDRRWNPSIEVAPNCPRCSSQNTKFCYYNNYSLSQPRYFCKCCRRYWTKGGSLRNVPVGGGCRKNPRGKSVRLSQTDGVSINYSRSLQPSSDHLTNDDPLGNSNGDSLVSPNSSTTVEYSDIDLAVVFAKFLNQNQNQTSSFDSTEYVGMELANEASASFGLPNSLNPINIEQEDIMIECEKPSDLIIGEGTQLLDEELPHQVFVGEKQQEEKIQELMGHDPNAFGLQTVLSDEVAHDVLWWDAPTLPNFAWQPMVQFQEFQAVSSDDQLKNINSANLVTDNWSNFDLLGYDVFSRS